MWAPLCRRLLKVYYPGFINQYTSELVCCLLNYSTRCSKTQAIWRVWLRLQCMPHALDVAMRKIQLIKTHISHKLSTGYAPLGLAGESGRIYIKSGRFWINLYNFISTTTCLKLLSVSNQPIKLWLLLLMITNRKWFLGILHAAYWYLSFGNIQLNGKSSHSIWM